MRDPSCWCRPPGKTDSVTYSLSRFVSRQRNLFKLPFLFALYYALLDIPLCRQPARRRRTANVCHSRGTIVYDGSSREAGIEASLVTTAHGVVARRDYRPDHVTHTDTISPCAAYLSLCFVSAASSDRAARGLDFHKTLSYVEPAVASCVKSLKRKATALLSWSQIWCYISVAKRWPLFVPVCLAGTAAKTVNLEAGLPYINLVQRAMLRTSNTTALFSSTWSNSALEFDINMATEPDQQEEAIVIGGACLRRRISTP